ncbi:MAG TPA: SH3 domain-containing protein, partial [Pyrinomonadaceae bacterium]
MHRPTTFKALAVCSLFVVFGVNASAQVLNLGGARQKITAASAVRARTAPDTSAAEVTRLKLGTVVSADARSAEQAEVGGKKDYWYRVALPGGQQGWVFGALLADYDPARRAEAVRRIVEERLKVEAMSFDDGVDLYNFVEAALADADVKGTERGELELARLQALNFAATGVGTDMQGRPMKPEFVKAHEREIYNHELAGQWAVKSEAFWELEKKYHGT